MSLRAFHFVFIFLSVVIMGLFFLWTMFGSSEQISLWTRILGYGSGLSALGLGIYGVWFYRKTRNIII
ncbi:MAG: hypothetical protein AAF514_04375 [Verrucomicrobiota bacterium]